jgi:hypothetical protein
MSEKVYLANADIEKRPDGVLVTRQGRTQLIVPVGDQTVDDLYRELIANHTDENGE